MAMNGAMGVEFLCGKPANNPAPKGSVQKLSSENAK
jgi:hypothetical protein